jgi:glycosyltransferase involved in cell wall biosynthesis
MRNIGIVLIGNEKWWTGGLYYLHHIIKCTSSLPENKRIKLRDVWWLSFPKEDPFKEVRDILGEPVIIFPPSQPLKRLARKSRKIITGNKGLKDLLEAQGIDALFPTPLCDNDNIPYIFWLPDFQYTRRPDLMDSEMIKWFDQLYTKHVKSATKVVLSSEDARKDFAEVFPNFLQKAHVVRFCSVPDDEWWRLDPESVIEKYHLPNRFLIICNHFTRHKNHMTLMRALKRLCDNNLTDIHLVCTGSLLDYRKEDYIGQVTQYLKENNLSAQVSILGVIPRAEQIALIRHAVAVLQPSWFEGWSTVVEDAKTLGKPIAVSNLPVHLEQLGSDHPYYLDLDDEVQWASAINLIWSKYKSGLNLSNEEQALSKLKKAQYECGLAFTNVFESLV